MACCINDQNLGFIHLCIEKGSDKPEWNQVSGENTIVKTLWNHCHVAYLGDVLLLNYNFQSLEAIWLFDHWASLNSLKGP
jgi:hypothetical protein